MFPLISFKALIFSEEELLKAVADLHLADEVFGTEGLYKKIMQPQSKKQLLIKANEGVTFNGKGLNLFGDQGLVDELFLQLLKNRWQSSNLSPIEFREDDKLDELQKLAKDEGHRIVGFSNQLYLVPCHPEIAGSVIYAASEKELYEALVLVPSFLHKVGH
jgi:hypothetical protein